MVRGFADVSGNRRLQARQVQRARFAESLESLRLPYPNEENRRGFVFSPPEGKAEADPAPPETGNGTIGGVYDWK